MGSRAPKAAERYHEETKHSYTSVRTRPHFLDWDNQPLPFKIYQDLESIPLPEVGEPRGVSALRALMASGRPTSTSPLEFSRLSRLLHYSCGITKRLRFSGGEMPFRAAACTGALYHIELYIAAGPLDGLEAGLYHYAPKDHAIVPLRTGDFRAHLVEASGGEPELANAEAIIVFTTTYWRNAWKYQARAYRHAFWDSGTILANLFAMAHSLELSAHLVLGFEDGAVNRLLDVDPDHEAALGLVGLGRAAEPVPPSRQTPEALGYKTVPLSRAEVDYPAIREMHQASSLETSDDARVWREEGGPPPSGDDPSADTTPLDPLPEAEWPEKPIESVIRRRGSARRFRREGIDYRALSSILEAATRGISADVLASGRRWSDVYLIANEVRGLRSGAYAYHGKARALETLKEGSFRNEARVLDLEQELAGDASVNVYMLVDLDRVLERFGDRGYRVAQLEGGLTGGRVYLASYALGLGATGLTFYDDAVTEFFSPHAAGKAALFLAAVGVPARRKILAQR